MSTDTKRIEEEVLERLRHVFDPEIPINIVEIGLVYDVKATPEGRVDVTMTLTAPNCPAAQSLPVEVESAALAVPGVSDARVTITFDPPWSPAKMSEAARLQLGMF